MLRVVKDTCRPLIRFCMHTSFDLNLRPIQMLDAFEGNSP